MQHKRWIMKKYYGQLKNNVLFKNMDLNKLEDVLNCLSAKEDSYKKNDFILLQGQQIKSVGIVLSGSINIIKEDLDGNINILAHLGINEIFAEAFAFADLEECPVSVQAAENCDILFIDCKRILKTCDKSCLFHASLIENMISLIAKKNILQNQKIEIISKRTTREKLKTYFNTLALTSHSKKFTIPYNREALANYLCVDRSALSRELCAMRDEGIIRFNKNEFEII